MRDQGVREKGGGRVCIDVDGRAVSQAEKLCRASCLEVPSTWLSPLMPPSCNASYFWNKGSYIFILPWDLQMICLTLWESF